MTTSTAKKASLSEARSASVTLGQLVGLDQAGAPLVRVGANELRARTTVALGPTHVGREVTLQFIDGDVAQPVITGVLEPEHNTTRGVRVHVDGGALKLSADREIVLECGPASIVLRSDGKLSLRGAHILSRATGTHRIRGGTVQLN